jgi:hypothetical protein
MSPIRLTERKSIAQGLIGFFDASLTPHVQRILLIDGPAVLDTSGSEPFQVSGF